MAWQRAPTNKRWEWTMAVLALASIALLARARQQSEQVRRLQDQPLQSAFASYRQEMRAIIAPGSRAPDFSASDMAGRAHTLRELLRGSRALVLAFLGGPSKDNPAVAGYLMEMDQRFRSRGLRVAALLEDRSLPTLPRWLIPLLRYPLLRDPTGAIARSYQGVQLPLTMLLDPQGRVISAEMGYATQAGATYIEEEVESRLTGQVRLVRYNPVLGIGKLVPDFVAQRSDGRLYRPWDERGRWYWLVLTSEDCPACGNTEDLLRPTAQQFRQQGGAIVWANPGGNVEESSLATVRLNDPLFALWRIGAGLSLPRVYLVDPHGVIRAQATSPLTGDKLRSLIPTGAPIEAAGSNALHGPREAQPDLRSTAVGRR